MSPQTLARLGAVAFAVAVAAPSLGGCATDSATNSTDFDSGGGGTADSGGGTPYDSGTTPYDAGNPTTDSGTPTGQCVSHCTTDNDCQNSCPSVDGGVSCCDTASSVCFNSATAACPAPAVDGGGPPPGY